MAGIFDAVKSLFSAPTIIENGEKMLDNAFFTDQEKSQFWLDWVKATAPMNLARRYIAIIVAVEWWLCVNIGVTLLLMRSPLFQPFFQFVDKVVDTQFAIVMTFYFMAHVAARIKGT